MNQSGQNSARMVEVPRDEWPDWMPHGLEKVWRSSRFLAQVFQHADGARRITVCRTKHNGKSWIPGISWDEIQEIKRECGYGECFAVEIYPADGNLVNVANMRHLWLVDEIPAFAWRKP